MTGLNHNMMYAPIILFVYNRPDHTLQTLEALSQNRLASESKLFIYADGPKSDMLKEQLDQLRKVREIAKSKQWCGKVEVIERKENLGLADNIVNGVTEIVNRYGKVIVLEDDIITSRHFLSYMNDSLNIYDSVDKVMSISSYIPKLKPSINLDETFFLKFMNCWGWATWKRAWSNFQNDPELLAEQLIRSNKVYEFDLDNSIMLFNQLEKNVLGVYKTWAVKWAASIFLNDGLVLYPRITLTINIGFDGSGTNCGKASNRKLSKLKDYNINVSPILLKESEKGRAYFIKYYQKASQMSLFKKIYTFYYRHLRKYIRRN